MSSSEWDTLFEAEADPDPTTFVLDSEQKVNWLLSKLAALEGERLRIKAQYEERLRQVETDEDGLHARFDADLERFARERLEGSKRKSLTLLQGTLAFRRVPQSYRVADPGAALDYVEQAGLEGLTRVELIAADYRKLAVQAMEDTGELLPGIDRTPERESFSIRFGGKEG